MSEALDKFERDMKRKGCGIAPNGATYKMIAWGWSGDPAVERTYKGHREIIVGFNGEQFATLESARLWAVADGRREYGPNQELSKRKLLA